MREEQNPTGRLHIVLIDPRTGQVIDERRAPNLVTTAGRALLAELLTGVSTSVVKIEMAVGGSKDPTSQPKPPEAKPEDTALNAECLRVPTVADRATQLTDKFPPRIVIPISATLETNTSGEVLVLAEAGLIMTKLNTSSEDPTVGASPSLGKNEVLYNRVVFPTITKQPDLQMTLTWDVIF